MFWMIKNSRHMPLAAAAVEAHGGCYQARGGAHDTTEGSDYARNVIVNGLQD